MQLQNSLDHYIKNKKIPAAKPTEKGGYKLHLDKKEIYFTQLPKEKVAIYALLPSKTATQAANIAKLMTVQSGLMRKWREALALEPKTEKLILQRLISVSSLTPSEFEKSIREFCSSFDIWNGYLNNE